MYNTDEMIDTEERGEKNERDRIDRGFSTLTFKFSSRFKASSDYEMLVEFVEAVREMIKNP